jgi:hypothetical protein
LNVHLSLEKLQIFEISVKYKTLANLEKIMNLGFKQKFTMALDELDKLLNTMEEGRYEK